MNSQPPLLKISVVPAHPLAQTFYQQHSNLAKAKQVYLNTLAVYAVNLYCQERGIKPDLDNSNSWNPFFQTIEDIADLLIQGVGRLECCPVLANSHSFQISESAYLSERIGYVAVQLNYELTEATLLGFVTATDGQDLSIDCLQPLEKLINSLKQQQERLFFPPANFFENTYFSNLQNYQKLCAQAEGKPAQFWGQLAQQELFWFETWKKVENWNPPFAEYFVGGKINISYNCLDRHLLDSKPDKPALIWEGSGKNRTFTYAQLLEQVCQMANVLQQLGVAKGDRVGIYFPMIPEAVIAMLACARIGAIHSVVFAGFSSEILSFRLNDTLAKVLITADGGFVSSESMNLKEKVDQALKTAPSVEKVLVVKHSDRLVNMQSQRDYWWHELQGQVSRYCLPQIMDSEDPLFILYTSGTTGKPKGIVHTTGGYNLHTHVSAKWIFDFKPTDVYWCTADIGWITGHSYLVYGPLSNGTTIFFNEGDRCFSHPNDFWDLIQKYQISIFYTTPSTLRTLKKKEFDFPDSVNSSSLRLLGTVGEPIDPQTWDWYYNKIGKQKCPIVDTWWQTETGAVMIASIPGLFPSKKGSVAFPLPGVKVDIVDEKGNSLPSNTQGNLVIKSPWPGMMRSLYNEVASRMQNYWQCISEEDEQPYYLTGDRAYRDLAGYIWVNGRIDNVIKVAGYPLSATEIEFALMSHPAVFEAAVVGCYQEDYSQEIHAFVVLNSSLMDSQQLTRELKNHVIEKIGNIASLKTIHFLKSLPKTICSKKIMHLILRDIVSSQKSATNLSAIVDSKTWAGSS